VAAVDLEHFRLRRQIPLDGAPTAVVTHPKGDPAVYVLAPDAGTVYEIHSGNLAVGRRVKAGNQAISMLPSPSGDALWVLYRDPASLVEIPLKTMQAGKRIPLRPSAESFDVTQPDPDHPVDPMAVVCCPKDKLVVIASFRDNTQRTVPLEVQPDLACFRKDGQLVMASSRADRTMTIVDVPTGRTVVHLPLPIAPSYQITSAQGGMLFLTGQGVDGVVIVFPYSTEVWQTVLAGHGPGPMLLWEPLTGPNYLIVTNPSSNSVTVLDPDTTKLVAVIGVGESPCQVLMAGGKRTEEQFMLAVNEKSGDLAVVRMLALTEPQLTSKPRFRSASLFTMIPVGESPVSAAVVAM